MNAEIALLGFKISKLSGGGFPQTPYKQVPPGTHLQAPSPSISKYAPPSLALNDDFALCTHCIPTKPTLSGYRRAMLKLICCLSKILNKAEIIKENAVQQCKDEVNIQVRIIIELYNLINVHITSSVIILGE